MEKKHSEDIADFDLDTSTSDAYFWTMLTQENIEEEAATFAHNIILPTMFVEPATTMEMRVRLEELDTHKSAKCYTTKSTVQQWDRMGCLLEQGLLQMHDYSNSGGEIRDTNTQRRNDQQQQEVDR
eukprot:15902078-Heterocapsa_arctica.AAC.1